ncbi:hypothetical protein HWV62_5630 [Athelia sp. TMB]|nr:hypothetical protein HWV62_5630 [Athelia sp. TMB]
MEARDAATGNYPEEGDCVYLLPPYLSYDNARLMRAAAATSSGGYGSPTDTFSGFYPSGKSKAMLFMPEIGLDTVEVDADTLGMPETLKGWENEEFSESWNTKQEA